MKTLKYTLETNSPVTKLWKVVTQKETYDIWTKAFSEWSTMEWKWWLWEKILFIDPGIWWTKAEVVEYEENKIISMRHFATLTKDKKEELTWEMTEKWIWSIEKYLFSETSQGSTLEVEVSTDEIFIPMFDSAWPKALENIKSILEK